MSGRHRASRFGALWLFGVALAAALTLPLGLPAALSTGDRSRPAAPATSTTPPRTADSVLRPPGGCPDGFGPSPAISGVCVSPAPEATTTRTSARLPRTPTSSTPDPPTTTEDP